MHKLKNTPSVGENVEQGELSYSIVGNVHYMTTLGIIYTDVISKLGDTGTQWHSNSTPRYVP